MEDLDVQAVHADTLSDGFLAIDEMDTGTYGNGLDGQSDSEVSFVFEAEEWDLILSFEVWDALPQEVEILVNGESAGFAAPSGNQEWTSVTVSIDGDLLEEGENTLTFRQADNPEWDWGVTDIMLTVHPPLEIGTYETGEYGNHYNGSIDADGTVTFHFQDTGTDLTLYATGYDIDILSEVEVVINGVSLGSMLLTEDNGTRLSTFHIPAELLREGFNRLSFEQTQSADWRWGVTDILLMAPGPQPTYMSFDPEFSDDGFVTWQDPTGFHLGRIDLNTGVLIEIVNTIDITPTSLQETWQGPELIRTASNGMGAIGMAPEGLVYVSETEARLLEGTEGMRIAFTPKGEVDRLRFIMLDADGNYFLYDEGAITELDLGGGRVTNWLNPDEVMVNFGPEHGSEIALYNVETGELTTIIRHAYDLGHQAGFTSSEGERMIILNHGMHHDLWRDTGDGWELHRRLDSPLDGGTQLWSPEFFEWQGRIFISGYVSNLTGTGASALAIYDIQHHVWGQISEVGVFVDPEVVALNDGSIAYYYTDQGKSSQMMTNVSYKDFVLAATLDKSMEDGPPEDLPPWFKRPDSIGGAAAAAFTSNAGQDPDADRPLISASMRAGAWAWLQAPEAEDAILSDTLIFRPMDPSASPAEGKPAPSEAEGDGVFADPFGGVLRAGR